MQTTVMTKRPLDLRVGNLFQDRKQFLAYPPFQRDRVWNLRKKQGFIDSLLRGFPTLAFLVMEDVNQEGDRLYQIVDGQQRLEAVWEFKENGFTSMTEKEAKRRSWKFDPISPGLRYDALPKSDQNALNDYSFLFIPFGKESEDVLEEIFIRVNEQEPLTVGERLFARNCRARHVALKLLEHPFWHETYTGQSLRKEAYQASMSIVALEILKFPLTLRVYSDEVSPLSRLIAGEFDDDLSTTFTNTIWQRLTGLERAFAGAHISSKTDMIPVYEAGMLLDERGFDVMHSKEGCLSPWFMAAKRGTINERLQRKISFRQLDYISIQKVFWSVHAEEIVKQAGLKKG